MIAKDEIAGVIDEELAIALDIDRALDSGSRQMAIDYYVGALPANDTAQPRDMGGEEGPPAVADDPNRAAVSLDVADMTEAVLSQLMPALEAPGAIEFEAMGPDDEQQAQKESAIIRSIIMEGRAGEGGFVAMTEAVKDALLMRTGVLSLWVRKKKTRTPEEWEGVPETAVGDLIKPNQPEQTIEKLTFERDEASEAERAEQGEVPEDAPQLYKVKMVRVDVEKRLVLCAVPRESYVTSNAQTRDANEARFCADRMVKTRSDWIAEGLPAADIGALPAWKEDGQEGWIDRNRAGTSSEQNSGAAAQVATDSIELWRCYVILADSTDGLSGERYRVFYSRQGKAVIGEPEQVGRVCYSLGVVTIFPHRLEGVSLWDSIAEIQELKSKGLRNWTENLHKVNRHRLGVDETLVNLADAADATQDLIRMKGPNGIVPIPALDAGPSIMAFLSYQDQARGERGGASLDMQSATMQIASNQTAAGIDRQYSSKEARAAMMARTFAETGLRQVWIAAHYLLRTQWGGTIAAKIGGQWVEDDPTKWRPRTGVIVHVGESRSQQAQRGAAINTVMGAQAQLMQAGMTGVLTDPSRMFNAFMDWCYANNLRTPERYFIDPTSPPALKAAKQSEQKIQAQQQQAAATQAGMARAAMMLEKYKVDQKSLTDLIDTLVKAAIEEAKLTLMPDPLEEVQQIAGQAAGEARASSAADVEAAKPGAANG
jgi:hypothetical protein